MFRSSHSYLSAVKVILFLLVIRPESDIHSAVFNLNKATPWTPTSNPSVTIVCLRNQPIKGYGNIHSTTADLVLFPGNEAELEAIINDVRQHNETCSGESEKKTLTVIGSRLSFAEQTLPPTCSTQITSVKEHHIAISTQQMKEIRLPVFYNDKPEPDYHPT